MVVSIQAWSRGVRSRFTSSGSQCGEPRGDEDNPNGSKPWLAFRAFPQGTVSLSRYCPRALRWWPKLSRSLGLGMGWQHGRHQASGTVQQLYSINWGRASVLRASPSIQPYVGGDWRSFQGRANDFHSVSVQITPCGYQVSSSSGHIGKRRELLLGGVTGV